MNRYPRPAPRSGILGGVVLEDDSIYYLNGGESKKPNIISRSKGRLITVGSPPSSLTTVLIPSIPDEDLGIATSISAASTCVSQSIATPVVTPCMTSDSITMAHNNMTEMRLSEDLQREMLIITDPNVHLLTEGELAYLAQPRGEDQSYTEVLADPPQVIPNPTNSMTIQTDDGNVVLYLHEEGSDPSGAGAMGFGSDAQIIQTDAFSLMGTSNRVMGSEEDGGEAYVIVQIDEQGNTVLVPTSSFGNGINFNLPAAEHSSQTPETRPEQSEAEKPKPFRYILPDLEEDREEESHINPYINILQSTSHDLSRGASSRSILEDTSSSSSNPLTGYSPVRAEYYPPQTSEEEFTVAEPTSVIRTTCTSTADEEGAIETDRGTYRCKVCGKEAKLQIAMVNHINRAHRGERPFQCETCLVRFQYSASLKAHQKSQHQTAPKAQFFCTQCELVFDKNSDHLQHQRTVHGSVLPSNYMISLGIDGEKYDCDKCKKVYLSRYNWMRHALSHDPDNVPLSCRQCSKEFPNKKVLMNHIQAHQDGVSRPYECDICAKTFKSEVHMSTHRKIHIRQAGPQAQATKVTLIPLEPSSSSLATPVETESEASPQQSHQEIPGSEAVCPVCDASFPNPVALDQHTLEQHSSKKKIAILRYNAKQQSEQASISVPKLLHVEHGNTIQTPEVKLNPKPDPKAHQKKEELVPPSTAAGSQELKRKNISSPAVGVSPPKKSKEEPEEGESAGEPESSVRRSVRSQGKVNPILEEMKKKSGTPKKEAPEINGKRVRKPKALDPEPEVSPQQLIRVEPIEIKSVGAAEPVPIKPPASGQSKGGVKSSRPVRAVRDKTDVQDSFFQIFKRVKGGSPSK